MCCFYIICNLLGSEKEKQSWVGARAHFYLVNWRSLRDIKKEGTQLQLIIIYHFCRAKIFKRRNKRPLSKFFGHEMKVDLVFVVLI